VIGFNKLPGWTFIMVPTRATSPGETPESAVVPLAAAFSTLRALEDGLRSRQCHSYPVLTPQNRLYQEAWDRNQPFSSFAARNRAPGILGTTAASGAGARALSRMVSD
jgi:hypothetical protein